MQRRMLGNTTIETSALGFGCVQLTSHPHRKEAVALLEYAFDAGITHFDVARSYGFGRAEGILSGFLQGKRDRVTVATKLGFELAYGVTRSPRLISLAKKILSPLPGVLKHVRNRAGSAVVKGGAFTPQKAIASLETSLRELKTDYIDLLLLHEATAADVENEPLLEALQRQITKGTVRCLGIASDFEKLQNFHFPVSPHYSVLQFNESVVDQHLSQLPACATQRVITHSVFKHFEKIQELLQRHPALTEQAALKLNLDLLAPEVLSSLMLNYAFINNPNGVTLFSSMNPLHIKRNVMEVGNCVFDQAQLLSFAQFIKQLLLQKEFYDY